MIAIRKYINAIHYIKRVKEENEMSRSTSYFTTHPWYNFSVEEKAAESETEEEGHRK